MRQRVLRVALVAVLVALVLLAVPLATAMWAYFFADERNELEREALAAAVRVGPDFAAGDPVELPKAGGEVRLGVYDTRMRLRAGHGPARADTETRRAGAGTVVRGHADGDLVAAVPVSQNEKVIGIVRAASPARDVWGRVLLGWLALGGVVLIALTAAVLVARRQARALTAPLEALSRQARAVTEGDLTARAAPSPIAEIDQVARTHNAMVERLAQLLQRERDFTANASHQLRTPLTGLQLGLETALTDPHADPRAALQEALESTGHLHHTIDEVLRLAGAGQPSTQTPAAVQPLSGVLGFTEQRWHGLFADTGRRLTVAAEPETQDAPVPGRTVGQILDVLLDNALRHGRGRAEVTARSLGDTIAIDVQDEGSIRTDPAVLFDRGHTTGAGAGIGLALAKDLAETAGGRLALAGTDPTTFTLLLPPCGVPEVTHSL
ncbi:sensor histidine kinase [Streptomyces sp. NPDC058424]|uniref:sensor histidine kinase n=1 Tax=Streptomyces sp. NPDC058424 TaxID=3346491 RepID=UPI00365116B1